MIRTFILTLFLTVYILLVGPPLLVYTLLAGDSALLYRMALGGVLFGVRLAGARIRVEGLENIPPGPCLFAANHTSSADAPAVVGAIPRQVAILLKESLFRWPIIGQAFRLAKFVPVRRTDRESAMASIERGAQGLRSGTSFLIYPEGTRSPDGRLQAFKKGAVVLAIKAGVPIVPVACAGAHKVMAKRSMVIRPGEIVVRFCPPIETTGYTVDQRDELNAVLRAALAAGLPPEQRPLDAASAAESTENDSLT
ncbi:MAG: 1-acyl-sn-glycerol-3-phosphate acyltransferase [Acidobacteriia bacterium]|nr:1-acyl-sn-glycerol-3-phosphate acyltransferase [Terriglobia bacterium]